MHVLSDQTRMGQRKTEVVAGKLQWVSAADMQMLECCLINMGMMLAASAPTAASAQLLYNIKEGFGKMFQDW